MLHSCLVFSSGSVIETFTQEGEQQPGIQKVYSYNIIFIKTNYSAFYIYITNFKIYSFLTGDEF